MRVLIEQKENEGLIGLLGKEVVVFTSGYFYTGLLVGVNEACIKLQAPKIIYETGAFSDSDWKDAQSLCVEFWYVATTAIESFGQV